MSKSFTDSSFFSCIKTVAYVKHIVLGVYYINNIVAYVKHIVLGVYCMHNNFKNT